MKKLLLLAVVHCMVIVSCTEDKHGPLSDDESVPPSVSDIRVENLPGSARLRYTLPVSNNVLYVKAVYTINGTQRETIASYKVNNMLLEGFNTTDEYVVKVYSVSKSEILSEPVYVTVQPQTPPIETVYSSLHASATFGGIFVTYENSEKANVSISVMTRQNGEWSNLDTHYTSLESGDFSIRGLENTETDFAICVRDRWLNSSDTLYTTLTPLFEEELDIRLFRDVRFSGEAEDHSATWSLPKIWDNDMKTGLQVKLGSAYPFWFTFDLGVTAQLSRFMIWQRPGSGSATNMLYNNHAPHEWELWGSNNPDAGWENWTLLGHFIMTKPSGLPVGQNSADDIEAGKAGNGFDFEDGIPPVRYIRWKHIDSWSTIGGTSGSCSFMEIRFYGAEQN